MACPGSFPSCCGGNHPHPKSGQVVVEMLGCTTSCWGNVHNPTFWRAFFLIFIDDSLTFANDPIVVKSAIGSAPLGLLGLALPRNAWSSSKVRYDWSCMEDYLSEPDFIYCSVGGS